MAACADAIIGMIIAVPFWILSGMWVFIKSGTAAPYTYTLSASVYGFLGFALIHYYFLNKNGQTIGKMLLNIRIVSIDDRPIGGAGLLLKRYLPMSMISLVPFIGSLLALVDVLFIFRKDRRCVHDLIARTKVVIC